MNNLDENKVNQVIQISKELEEIKSQMKLKQAVLDSVLEDLGTGAMFQDPSDGVVFKIIQPKGAFVSYKTIGYDRTKRGEEKRGSLSAKEAKENGFSL